MHLAKIISDLTSISSTNEKVEYLKQHCDEGWIKELLFYTYNPYYTFGVSYVKFTDCKDAVIDEKTFSTFKKILDRLKDRKLTGNEALDVLVTFGNYFDKESQNAILAVLNKNLKCGASTGLIKKAFGAYIPEFKVQLANAWKKEKDYKDVKYWYASLKLDGLRCITLEKPDLFTRTGKDVVGFQHIQDELEIIKRDFDCEFIDGELYSPNLPFQTIQSYVTRSKNVNKAHKQQINFNIFAIGNPNIKTTDDMIRIINSIAKRKFKYVKILPQIKIPNDPKLIYSITEKLFELGHEGLMLRNPHTPYEWKRSDALMKVKVFREADFRVFNIKGHDMSFLAETYIEGTGKYKGMLGAIKIEGEAEIVEGSGQFVKVKNNVGSGFSDEMRQWIWDNRKNLLGKLIEIKFVNLTDKPDDDGFYALRFPTFNKFKLDRD